MKVINGYVFWVVASAILLVLVGFVGLDLVFRLIDETDNIAGNYHLGNVIIYELMRTPARFYDVMPIAGLIGCLAGLGSLANTSELVVMRSAGISVISLVKVAIRPALIFMLMGAVVGEYVAPKAEQVAYSYRSNLVNKNAGLDVDHGLWLRDGSNFVFVNVVQPNGVMYGLHIFEFDGSNLLQTLRKAKRATFDGDTWLLEDVAITRFVSEAGIPQAVTSNNAALFRWQTSIRPELLNIAVVSPDDLQLTALWQYIGYLKQQNLNSVEFELAFWEKVFYPLVMISLVLVGISFVFGPLRQVTMGYRVFWGVIIGILFKTLQDTLGPVSIVFGFSPMIAMLVPALLCGVIGIVLLLRVR